jgi:predicted branched-subunit amino acid permease
MTGSISNSAFLRGALAGIPFVLLAAPFALLYGVLASEAGLSLAQAMGFSVFLIAGAAQFAALQQMLDGAPVIVVLAAALTVNLRMAMYSASLVPHLGAAPLWQRLLVAYMNFDQSYAYAMVEYDRRPEMSAPDKAAWFLGVAMPVALSWYLCTYLGAALGARMPEALPLDFALPIMFISLAAPMLKTRAHGIAAAVSIVAGLALAGMPWGTGLLVAAGLALLAGALAEGRA